MLFFLCAHVSESSWACVVVDAVIGFAFPWRLMAGLTEATLAVVVSGGCKGGTMRTGDWLETLSYRVKARLLDVTLVSEIW
jgi:hypothetical protein